MFTKIIKCILFSLTLVFLCTLSLWAKPCSLTLESYLYQVVQKNYGLHSSELAIFSAKKRRLEAQLQTSPILFAEGEYLKNSLDPLGSILVGNAGQTQSYKMGVSQTTSYGIEGKLYYNYQIQGVNPLTMPFLNSSVMQIFTSSPVVEFSIPLGRNFGGKETRANRQLIDAQALYTNYSQSYQVKKLLVQAEDAYWKLSISREIVNLQKESQLRAEKIYAWVANRKTLRLAEESDLLQAKAAVESKQLDLENAKADEKVAAQSLNTFRGIVGTVVKETLSSYGENYINSLQLSPYHGPRDDVRAAWQARNVSVANAKLGIEKNKPNVELYGSYAFNGNNPVFNQAIAESFTTNYPSTALGLRLSIPLAIKSQAIIRNGYQTQINSANEKYKQALFDDQQQWQNLVLQFNNAKQRLHIASALTKIQNQKLLVERDRLVVGKTTTYQVIMFEQDYANAQVTVLMIQDQLLAIYAQTFLWKHS